MNDVYFVCPTCGLYIDAGYRWAYSTLEQSGTVTRGRPIDVDAVLNHDGYWQPPDDRDSRHLIDSTLPAVTRFLKFHRGHSIHYLDSDTVFDHTPDLDTSEEAADPWFEIKH